MVHIYMHIYCALCVSAHTYTIVDYKCELELYLYVHVCPYIHASSYMHKSLHTCIFLQYVIIKSVVLTMSVTCS